MKRLSDAEIRRLLNHLRDQITDFKDFAEIEDELRGEFAEEFLREPEILSYFPALQEQMEINSVKWVLRIIPHARLRMTQRAVSQATVRSFFQRFIEFCDARGEVVTTGPYAIRGRAKPRDAILTLRFDIDVVSDETGQAHLVTVVIGQSDSGRETTVDLS